MTSSTAFTTSRLLNVQCLRAIAAILVIGVHAERLELRVFPTTWLHPIQAFGGAGVDLFFVISGLIMVTTTWGDFGRPGSSLTFLLRRVLRIYPMYWIIMGVYLALHTAAPSLLHLENTSPQAIVFSLLLIPQPHDPTLVVAWTLVCEMFFYLVFAIALTMSRRAALVFFVAWIILTIALSALKPENPVLAQIGSLYNLEFAAGAVVGYLIRTGRIVAPLTALATGIVGLAATFVYLLPFDDLPSIWFRVGCIAVPMSLITYGAVALEVRDGRRLPRWLARIGDASYSLYLWHGFLLAAFSAFAFRLHPRGAAAHGLYLATMYAFTILASVVIYRLIERPTIKWLHGTMEPARRTAVDAA